MRGLTIIVVSADAQRFAAALAIASAHAALGGQARVYLHDAAVGCLLPTSALGTALELGVILIACQTGLADAAIPLPAGVDAGGLVSLLAELGDDRLVTV
jgi:hypothetical protein